MRNLGFLSFHVIYVPHDHRTPTAICTVFEELGEISPFLITHFLKMQQFYSNVVLHVIGVV